ncbi:MAG TPA: hypothetical protein PLB91_11890 [Spirochaetales bacterium]|nr:hypothetical protein [Spirochaetales bacterium]HRY53263.1 hypothetical protein [Spirochaetia bacterium]HRZ64494.1 hypothetical protein [Spirochaetia bacterium]
MPNRFARRIRAGEIDTVEALKSEFKALAKTTHPDLAGPGASGGEFSALRAEYEEALRGFLGLRYGGPASDLGEAPGHDRRALYAELARLLARGFPKRPRHEKERARYERERYLFRARLRAWEPACPALFDAFEAAMLDLRASGGGEAFDETLALLASILEYHASGVEAARAVAELGFARFRAPAPGPARGGKLPAGARERDALCGFIGMLIGDMGLGPALAGRARGEGR